MSSTSIAELAKQAREEQQPMSDARLAELTRDTMFALDEVFDGPPADETSERHYLAVRENWKALTAENERLRAREAALVAKHEQAMAIVREVAESNAYTTQNRASHFMHVLFLPHVASSADIDALIEQARALLASTEVDASDAPDTDTDDPPSLYWK